MNDRLSKLYEIEKDLLSELDSIRKAIVSFGGSPSSDNTSRIKMLPDKNYEVHIPVISKDYPKEGTWEEKIKYSLRDLGGTGDSPAIVAVIKKNESSLKYEKIYKAVQMYTSSLAKTHKLKADRTGPRVKWAL